MKSLKKMNNTRSTSSSLKMNFYNNRIDKRYLRGGGMGTHVYITSNRDYDNARFLATILGSFGIGTYELAKKYPQSAKSIAITALIATGWSILKSKEKEEIKNKLLNEIENNPKIFKSITISELKNDKKFILQAIKKNKDVWKYIPDSYKKDVDFCVEAVYINNALWNELKDNIKNDIDMKNEILIQIENTQKFKKILNNNILLKDQLEEFKKINNRNF